jgi:hypothetical protein
VDSIPIPIPIAIAIDIGYSKDFHGMHELILDHAYGSGLVLPGLFIPEARTLMRVESRESRDENSEA